MRKFVLLAFVVGAACGGGASSSKQTTPEPAPSPCIAMSQHMRDMVLKAGQEEQAGDDMLAKLGPIIERVVAERCQADAWSPEVIACVNAADDRAMDPCIEQLSDAQEQALEQQIEKELAPVIEESIKNGDPKGEPAGAPAPGSPPPPPEDPDGGGA